MITDFRIRNALYRLLSREEIRIRLSRWQNGACASTSKTCLKRFRTHQVRLGSRTCVSTFAQASSSVWD